MASKSARQIRSRWQFAVGVTLATVLCLVSVWVVSKRFTATTIGPSTLNPLPAPLNESASESAGELTKTTGRQTIPPPTSTTTPTASAQRTTPVVSQANQQTLNETTTHQGVFRIGNPTSYPVRIALLSQKVSQKAPTKAVGQTSYELPAHWDFAPEEGGTQGLLVSLPDRTLKLKKGDVLVAFAQDGSGRYWGPYVVDETALPLWNAKDVEWQLILQP